MCVPKGVRWSASLLGISRFGRGMKTRESRKEEGRGWVEAGKKWKMEGDAGQMEVLAARKVRFNGSPEQVCVSPDDGRGELEARGEKDDC